MKIILLNPPGDKIYLRDYYCSKVSKADYLYEPPDLVMLSGILSRDHELKVIDAIASGLDQDSCLRQIVSFGPGAVIFITGAVSYKNDFVFLSRVKRATGALMIGSGDLFLEGFVDWMGKADFLDAILLDFTDTSILDYLKGEKACRNIVARRDGEVSAGPVVRGHGQTFTIPPPMHTLFPLEKYRYPFVRHPRFATVLTDYGCPFRCKFCVMAGIGFKLREVEDVIGELKALKAAGVREVYFDDQTFGAVRLRTMRLLERMVEEKLSLGWCCFSRVDVVDEALLQKMKQAGCHTIMFGVESASQKILDQHAKGISVGKISEVIRLFKRHGLTTVATFVIGLPGETRETALETIRFAIGSGCDFASFNIAVPRVGTALRTESISSGAIDAGIDEMDQSGARALIRTPALTLEEIEELKNRAERMFYGRPGYLFGQFLRAHSFYDLRKKWSGFWSIIQRLNAR